MWTWATGPCWRDAPFGLCCFSQESFRPAETTSGRDSGPRRQRLSSQQMDRWGPAKQGMVMEPVWRPSDAGGFPLRRPPGPVRHRRFFLRLSPLSSRTRGASHVSCGISPEGQQGLCNKPHGPGAQTTAICFSLFWRLWRDPASWIVDGILSSERTGSDRDLLVSFLVCQATNPIGLGPSLYFMWP